jgi:hypothetical protein
MTFGNSQTVEIDQNTNGFFVKILFSSFNENPSLFSLMFLR